MNKHPFKIELKGDHMEGLESKYGLAKLEVKEATTEGAILHIKAYALAFNVKDNEAKQ